MALRRRQRFSRRRVASLLAPFRKLDNAVDPLGGNPAQNGHDGSQWDRGRRNPNTNINKAVNRTTSTASPHLVRLSVSRPMASSMPAR